MLTKVQKKGNCLALRIPEAIALAAHLTTNSIVVILLVNGQIIIKPTTSPTWSLEQLLAGINSDNIHQKIDTVKAIGNEVW